MCESAEKWRLCREREIKRKRHREKEMRNKQIKTTSSDRLEISASREKSYAAIWRGEEWKHRRRSGNMNRVT